MKDKYKINRNQERLKVWREAGKKAKQKTHKLTEQERCELASIKLCKRNNWRDLVENGN